MFTGLPLGVFAQRVALNVSAIGRQCRWSCGLVAAWIYIDCVSTPVDGIATSIDAIPIAIDVRIAAVGRRPRVIVRVSIIRVAIDVNIAPRDINIALVDHSSTAPVVTPRIPAPTATSSSPDGCAHSYTHTKRNDGNRCWARAAIAGIDNHGISVHNRGIVDRHIHNLRIAGCMTIVCASVVTVCSLVVCRLPASLACFRSFWIAAVTASCSLK